MIPEQHALSPVIIEKLRSSRVIAVIVIDELENAVPLAESIISGGVDLIELTLRTPIAMKAATMIIKSVPSITVGLGTVLTTDQVKMARDAGVEFAVSPGCNPRIIEAAQKYGLPFAPGISTPTDIEVAVSLGCRNLKYFPAATLGGMDHLKSMAAPYGFLGLQFIPLGGVNLQNAESYLRSPLISAIGGSWIAKRELIQEKQWTTITQNAQTIRNLIENIK